MDFFKIKRFKPYRKPRLPLYFYSCRFFLYPISFRLPCLFLSVFFLSSCFLKDSFSFKGARERVFVKTCSVSKIKKLLDKKEFKKLEKQAEICLQKNFFKEAFLSLELVLNHLEQESPLQQSTKHSAEESKHLQKTLLRRKLLQRKLGDIAFAELKDCEKAIKYYTDFLKPSPIPSSSSSPSPSSSSPISSTPSSPVSSSASSLAPPLPSLLSTSSPISSAFSSSVSSAASAPDPLKAKEPFLIKYRKGECFFKLKKYSQALRELEKAAAQTRDQKKQKSMLKARVLLNSHSLADQRNIRNSSALDLASAKPDPALDFLERQIELFPEEEAFFREYKALIYESKSQLSQAIDELKKIKPQTGFIKHKIFQLSERERNL